MKVRKKTLIYFHTKNASLKYQNTTMVIGLGFLSFPSIKLILRCSLLIFSTTGATVFYSQGTVIISFGTLHSLEEKWASRAVKPTWGDTAAPLCPQSCPGAGGEGTSQMMVPRPHHSWFSSMCWSLEWSKTCSAIHALYFSSASGVKF